MTTQEEFEGYREQGRKFEAALEEFVAENRDTDDPDEMLRRFKLARPELFEESKQALAMNYLVDAIEAERTKIARRAAKRSRSLPSQQPGSRHCR